MLKLNPDHVVVALEEVVPPIVAEASRELGGAHDIREHDGGQHSIQFVGRATTGARQEFLDLAHWCVDVPGPDDVIGAGKLDKASTLDLLGQPATRSHVHNPIAAPVEYQGWRLDRGQHLSDVYLEEHQEELLHHRRAGTKPFDAAPPLPG